MNFPLDESSSWRQVAIIEVLDTTQDLPRLVRDDALRFRIQPAERAPTGYQWYEILVDAAGGERRVARTAWAVLTALKKSAREGIVESLRIINGEHWLAIGDNLAETNPGDRSAGAA